MSQSASPYSERAREQRREQILAAALEVFAEKGFHSTRVSDVAARAGVSQGTIYWYFPSKEELFRAASMSLMESLMAPFEEILARQIPADEKLRVLLEMSLQYTAQHMDAFPLLFHTITTKEVAQLLADDLREFYLGWKATLASLFQEIGDPDPESAASLFMAIMDGLGAQLLIAPDMFDRKRIMAAVKGKFNLEKA